MNFLLDVKSQELELENAKSYIKELDLLEFFVRNVPLDTPSINKNILLNLVAEQLQKSFEIHKSKIFPLWMEFIERANNENLGITAVHLALLELLKLYSHFKLALKIVEHPGLPVLISIVKYQQYLILCAQIYQEYERYYEALEMLSLANSIEYQNFEVSFLALKQLIIIHRILGNHFNKTDFERECAKIKNSCNGQLQEFQHINPKKIEDITFESDIFYKICDEKELNLKELLYLKQKQSLELYQKIPKNSIAQTKNYIKSEIFNQTSYPLDKDTLPGKCRMYRVKQAELKDVPLHNFDVVRDINKVRPIYRSDAKKKILYVIHQYWNQAKLDSMINKACIMQRIIKNRPFESRSEREGQDEDRFDLMGGMRGMGMLGGIGGFGAMGAMGGFGGFGRR